MNCNSSLLGRCDNGATRGVIITSAGMAALLALLPAIGARALLSRRALPLSTAPLSRAAASMAARPSSDLADLVKDYYKELNTDAFDAALPDDMVIKWNSRLRRTAGRCHFYLGNSTQRRGPRAEIELSPHVLDSTERLRTTLAHEMCHAAQWLCDGEARPPHGRAFQRWARQVERRVPELRITTTHSYAIHTRYKHLYTCTQCGQQYGRHNRIDLRARCCGRCRGSLRLEKSAEPRSSATTTDSSRSDAHGQTRPMPAFAAFVAESYGAQRKRWPHVSHQRIMLALGRRWRRTPRARRGRQKEQS